MFSVPSLQALDCHREVEIRGRWRSVGGSGLCVAVHTARIGAHVAQITKQVCPEVTSALKSSEVGCSPLVPEFVSPAPVVLLFTDDFGDYGVFVSDRTGFAYNAEDFAHVTG